MPTTVTFATDGKTVTVEKKKQLMDICEEINSTIPFGCKVGTCGTCVVKVTKGMETLTKVNLFERNRLGDGRLREGFRLSCQSEIIADGELIVENG